MSSGAAFAVPMAQHPNNNVKAQPGDLLLPVIFILLGFDNGCPVSTGKETESIVRTD
jgi:hypothetical protein